MTIAHSHLGSKVSGSWIDTAMINTDPPSIISPLPVLKQENFGSSFQIYFAAQAYNSIMVKAAKNY